MNKLKISLLKEVIDQGIAFSTVFDFFNYEEIIFFEKTKRVFEKFKNDEGIKKRINLMRAGTPLLDTSKWYEITQFEYLNRALCNEDESVIDMYSCESIIEFATEFHKCLPKLRNVLTWVHPSHPLREKIASQKWHRDQEDYQILKIFIYFSNIYEENGALEYIKQSQFGGEYQDIMENKPGTGANWVFKSDYPKENIVHACGDIGTIIFVNTNGVHRGGNVEKGIRTLTQGNFLNPTAPVIVNNTLGTFNYDKNKINFIDQKSQYFKNLNEKQKFLLS